MKLREYASKHNRQQMKNKWDINTLNGRQTSICLLVLATSRGHVAPAARLPATKPAAKLAPNTLAALPSSPTRPSSFLRIYRVLKIWVPCNCRMNATKIRVSPRQCRHLRAQGLTSIYQRKEHPEQVAHPPQSTEHGSFVLFQHSPIITVKQLESRKKLRIVHQCGNMMWMSSN